MASNLAIRQKWIAGAKPAAPLFIAVGGALTVGLLVGSRHLRVNPEVLVSKHSRELDLTDGTRDAKVLSRDGHQFHDTAFRRYLTEKFINKDGHLNNDAPFLMRSMYGKDKH